MFPIKVSDQIRNDIQKTRPPAAESGAQRGQRRNQPNMNSEAGVIQQMGKTAIGLVFSFLLGLAGLVVAGWLLVTGNVISSIDDLFLTLFALLMALIAFSYIAWHFQAVLSEGDGKKKRR